MMVSILIKKGKRSKEVAICKQGREVSGEIKLANTFILDFQPPRR